MSGYIPLPQAAARIRADHGISVTYSRLFFAAASGTLPGLIRRGGRLFIEDDALPAVAAMFGPKSDAPRNAA